jgi:hypothetical protein
VNATAIDYAGVLAKFDRLRQSYTLSGRCAWYGRCPVCNDRSSSHLRLWIGESGRLHAKCYGGACGQLDRKWWFKSLLDAVGSEASEWFPGGVDHRPRRKRPMSKIVAVYPYDDAKGRLLYQCVKFAPGNAHKCAYRRPAYSHDDPQIIKADPDGGRWVWDGQGLDLDLLEMGEIVPAQHRLYRCNEIVSADPKMPILIPEGEPDVEVLKAIGFVATCNPHGGRNWPEYLGAELQGRRVVILEDNDSTGRMHVNHVAGLLLGLEVKSVRLVRFRDFAEGFDVSDWLYQAFNETGCPQRSYQIPAWIGTLDTKAKAAVKKAVTDMVKRGPEWSVLTEDEQATRLRGFAFKENPGKPMTLQEALTDYAKAA